MAAPDVDPVRRAHAWLGVVFLLPWVVADVAFLASGMDGRDAFVERWRSFSFASALFVTLTGLVPLVAHAVLGVHLVRTRRGRGPFEDEGARTLAWASAAVLAVFVPLHLRHTPLAIAWGDVDAFGLYARLRTELTLPAFVALYVVAFAALALHLHQGLFAAIDLLVRRERARRPLRLATLLATAAIYLAFVDAFSHFAVGRAIFRGDSGAARTAADARPSP